MSNLLEGWVKTTLGTVAYYVSNKMPVSEVDLDNYISTENLLADKMGVTQAATIPKVSKVNAFAAGDTLFSNIRTYFKKVWYSDKSGGASNDVLVFRPVDEEQLDKKYLYYLISNDGFIDYTVTTAKGTKMPRGDKDAIKQYPLSLPPLPEQKAIAGMLSAFDEKIELLREQNKTLETLAQTIFKEWFVNFNYPDATGDMVESELGEIPKGWRVGVIGDLFELHRGFDLPKKNRKEGAYSVYAAGGYHGQHKEYKMEPPGIITGRSGVIGKVYLSLTKYWPLNTTLYVRNFKACGPYYTYFFLNMFDLEAMVIPPKNV